MAITMEQLLDLKRRRDELYAQLGDWAEVLRILREYWNELTRGEPGAEPLPFPLEPFPPLTPPLPIPELPLEPIYPPGEEPPGGPGAGAGEGAGPGVLGLALIALVALSEQGGG